jgi:hypothetical protein
MTPCEARCRLEAWVADVRRVLLGEDEEMAMALLDSEPPADVVEALCVIDRVCGGTDEPADAPKALGFLRNLLRSQGASAHRAFYLSDGGYSRLVFDLETGEVGLDVGLSSARAMDAWAAARRTP